MNVDIGTEAAQFPGKEYINGNFVAVKALKDSASDALFFVKILLPHLHWEEKELFT
jgi:hypothetical protein